MAGSRLGSARTKRHRYRDQQRFDRSARCCGWTPVSARRRYRGADRSDPARSRARARRRAQGGASRQPHVVHGIVSRRRFAVDCHRLGRRWKSIRSSGQSHNRPAAGAHRACISDRHQRHSRSSADGRSADVSCFGRTSHGGRGGGSAIAVPLRDRGDHARNSTPTRNQADANVERGPRTRSRRLPPLPSAG